MNRRHEHQPVNASKDKRLSRFLQSPLITMMFGHLPHPLSRFYLGLFGTLYFMLAPDERRAIKKALEFCLENKGIPNGAKNYWKRTRKGIIDHYHEKLYLAFPPYDRVKQDLERRGKISGLETLNRTLDKGRGVIMVTGHYGAVEYLPAFLSFQGYQVTAMVHCNSKALREILDQRAARVGIKLLDPKSETVFFPATQHLKEGRILVTQCDEIDMWHPYKNKKINFLGLEMGLDKSLDILARKTRAPVLFGLNHRRGRRRYELVIEDPSQHPAAQGLRLVSAQCLALLESYIYMQPEAWYEWKKLKPFLEQTVFDISDENYQRLRLSDQMALHSAG